jgi:hypothetical protein
MANRFIAEVDAPEFGEGYTIRLDMDGHARLESKDGPFDFASRVGIGLAVMSSTYIKLFLSVALRGPDGAVVKSVPDITPPLLPIAAKCLDAWCLFREGKDAETVRADNENQAATANPLKGTRA